MSGPIIGSQVRVYAEEGDVEMRQALGPRRSRSILKRILVLMVVSQTFLPTISFARLPLADMSKAQAIARVRTILKSSTAGCRINSVTSVTAVKVKAGWRITARIVMSASGSRLNEKAVWIVSEQQGAAAQDQLTAEIQNRCNN